MGFPVDDLPPTSVHMEEEVEVAVGRDGGVVVLEGVCGTSYVCAAS